MTSAFRTAALALAVVVLASACTTSSNSGGASPAAAAPTTAEAARVGAADSGCALPVSFGLVASYLPKAPDMSAAPELADLLKKGPMSLVCEIDAKPAGAIGFLRVYTGPAGDLRDGLTEFAGAGAEAPAFTELQVGGAPALEIVYREKNTPECAFAVTTPQGIVTVALDSLDEEEHQAILPAYELAKSSLTLA